MSDKDGSRASAFRVYQALPNQLIPNGIATPVRLDVELFDRLDEFDVATYLFTPHRAGYYFFDATVFSAGAVPIVQVLLYIEIVGGVTIGVDNNFLDAGAGGTHNCVGMIYLTPNDSVRLIIQQWGVANLQLVAGPTQYVRLTGFRVY